MQYFRHNKFSSFRRQLNLYGYRKVIKGPDAGAYMHPSFQRDRPDLLGEVKKGKVRADTRKSGGGRGAGRRKSEGGSALQSRRFRVHETWRRVSSFKVTACHHADPARSVRFLLE